MAHQSRSLTPATWLCPIKSLHSSKTKKNISEWRRKRSWADLSQLNCDRDDDGGDDEARALIKEKKGPQALSDVEKKGSSLWCIFLRTARSEQMTAAHLATGSAWDWFIVKVFFFTHDSIWYGVGYMLPNMPVQMFSQLGVLSPVSALASDEACWQRNGS